MIASENRIELLSTRVSSADIECQCGGASLDLDLFRLLINGQPCDILRADSRNCTINDTNVATSTLSVARSLNCTSPCFSIFFSAQAPAPGSATEPHATRHGSAGLTHVVAVRVAVGAVVASLVLAVFITITCLVCARQHRACWNKKCESIKMQMALITKAHKHHSGSSVAEGMSSSQCTADRDACEEGAAPPCSPTSESGESEMSPMHDSAYDPEQCVPVGEAHHSGSSKVAQPSTSASDRPAIQPLPDYRDTGRRSSEERPVSEPATDLVTGDKGHFTSRSCFDRSRCTSTP